MLRTRLITGVVLAILFLLAVASPSSLVFYCFCGLALVIAGWEWSGLAGISGVISKIALTLFVLAMLLAIFLSIPSMDRSLISSESLIINGLYIVIFLWPLFLILVIAYPRSQRVWNNRPFKIAIGALVFVQAWVAVIWTREQEFYGHLMIYAIALVALSDIGAYFAGKKFGQIKLAANVSPGKSWEGVFGGVLVALLFATIVHIIFGETVFNGLSLLLMLLIALVVSLVSVLGDLSISMLKRAAGIKDTGNILPGHGGVLDRIDGMLAALPVFAFLMHLVKS